MGLLNQRAEQVNQEGQMDEGKINRFQQLFQQAYELRNQAMTTLMNHAKTDPDGAVVAFVSEVITGLIQQTGEQDDDVLGMMVVALIQDTIGMLEEEGLKIRDAKKVIQHVTQQLLTSNPDVAERQRAELQGGQNAN